MSCLSFISSKNSNKPKKIKKYIENTHLHEEHETNQLEEEHVCDEESEERSEGLTVVRAAKE